MTLNTRRRTFIISFLCASIGHQRLFGERAFDERPMRYISVIFSSSYPPPNIWIIGRQEIQPSTIRFSGPSNSSKKASSRFSDPTLKYSDCLRRQKQSHVRLNGNRKWHHDRRRNPEYAPSFRGIPLQNIQRRGSSYSRRNPGDVRLRQLMTVVRVIAPTVA